VSSAKNVEELLTVNYETRGFEVKGPGLRSHKAFLAKVVRAALAMGNLPDKGRVCIGIDNDKMAAMQPGLDATQFAERSNSDAVAAAFAEYADPPLELSIWPRSLSSGAQVVVIDVEEFRDIPHFCKKDYPGVLRRGALYVRPRGKPESVEVSAPTELREVVELATEKQVRRFVRIARAAGIELGASAPTDLAASQYADETQRGWAETATDQLSFINGRGHWEVSVRPEHYQEARIPFNDLKDFVTRRTVRLRGWPLPFVDNRDPVMHGQTWTGQDLKPRGIPHAEAWRMFQSGQFLQKRVISADLEQDPQSPIAAAGSIIQVWEILSYLTEVFELAARMALAIAVEESVHISARLTGMDGRQLISGSWSREIDGPYVSFTNVLAAQVSLATPDLIAAPRSHAVTMAQEFLQHFGLRIADEVAADWQAELIDRAAGLTR
jgi:hypothetical protein